MWCQVWSDEAVGTTQSSDLQVSALSDSDPSRSSDGGLPESPIIGREDAELVFQLSSEDLMVLLSTGSSTLCSLITVILVYSMVLSKFGLTLRLTGGSGRVRLLVRCDPMVIT